MATVSIQKWNKENLLTYAGTSLLVYLHSQRCNKLCGSDEAVATQRGTRTPGAHREPRLTGTGYYLDIHGDNFTVGHKVFHVNITHTYVN